MTFRTATDDPNRYIVVQRSGTDTLHINPREECNTDDADNVQQVDRKTAEAYAQIITHNAEAELAFCRHCVSLSWYDSIREQPTEHVVNTAVVTTPVDPNAVVIGYELAEASDGIDSDIPYVVQENPEAEAIIQHKGHEYRVPISDAKPRKQR